MIDNLSPNHNSLLDPFSFNLNEPSLPEEHKIEYIIEEHGILWKIQQIALALLLTIATLGIGLVIPSVRQALKVRWEQALTGKLIIQRLIEETALAPETIDAPNSSHPSLGELAQEKLDQIIQEYIQDHQSTLCPNMMSNLEILKSEIDKDEGLYIFPDAALGCLLLPFDEQSKVFFAPDSYYLTAMSSGCDPSTEEGFDFLENILSTAFACGKEFVVIRLSNGSHSVAAAFQSNGEFKIIDSMSNDTVHLSSLIRKLNRSQLKNEAGEIISFKGEYINTHLQKGGLECMRFATLYGYQMAKKQSLEAYQEVNGAFAAGRLNTFEDIANMDGAKPIRDASRIPRKNYRSFMHSWAYRAMNIKTDDWKELTLADLRRNDKSISDIRAIYILNSSDFIVAYPTFLGDLSELERSSCPFSRPLPSDWEQTQLASLIPTGEEKVVIIADPNQDPQIFCASQAESA